MDFDINLHTNAMNGVYRFVDMKIVIVFIAMLLLGQTAKAELNLELPETFLSSNIEGSFNNIPVNFSSLGLKRLRSVRKAAAVIEDPEINDWIRGIGQRLVAQTSYSNRPFYFVVVRNENVNAFAAQGGLIVINSGLILRSETESELVAVMAHEVAHLTQQHIERMIAQDQQNKIGNAAAVVAGLLVGSKDATAGQAIVASAFAVDAHMSLQFGRSAETEADREGLRILAKAGFDPNGMTRFLRKLGGGSDARYSGITEYLRSHPLTDRRVDDVGQRASRYGAYKSKPTISYHYMREKLRVLTRQPISSNKVPSSVKNYGSALQAYQQGKAAVTSKMLAKSPKTEYEIALLAKSFIQQKQFDKAIQLLKPQLVRNPNSESLLIVLSDALIGLKRYAEAWKHLERVELNEQTSLEFLGTRQEVARLAGRTGQAYLSIAERNIRIGLYKHAQIQLNQALKTPNLTPYDRQGVGRAIYRAKQFKNAK